MHRVDPIGLALRSRTTIKRRVYNVAGPHHLWHLDGHHKLHRWNLVTHAAIDGFSRLVTFIHCSDNNRARTVLESFVPAVTNYGIPSRIRIDKGDFDEQDADIPKKLWTPSNVLCQIHNIFISAIQYALFDWQQI
eukprot:gene4710-6611_t